MRKVLLFTLVIGVCSFNRVLAFAPPLPGNTYTINSAVATGGTNYQTFADAVAAMQGGISGPVIFNVAPASGPYNEQVVITAVPGTSTTNTVTFNCNGVTLNFTTSNSFQRAGVKLEGAHHIIFDNLNVVPLVTSDLEYGYGFHLVNDADSNIIRKCSVVNTYVYTTSSPQYSSGIVVNGNEEDEDGLGISHCDYNIITQNTVSGGYYGIILTSYDSYSPAMVTMDNNQVTNNTVKDFINVGITLLWGNNTLVEGNDITCLSTNFFNAGIQLNENSYSTMVRGNRVHNFRSASGTTGGWRDAIDIENCRAAAGRENVIANNLVYDFDSPDDMRGIKVGLTSSWFNIFHNTVSFDNAGSVAKSFNGIYLENTGSSTAPANLTNLKIENNIFTITAGGTGTKRAFYSSDALAAYVLDHNDYYVSSATGTLRLATYKGTNYTTLATWQAARAQDYHSMNIDPLFTNPASANYLPTATDIDNRGVNVGVAKDIVATVRSTTAPDPGAYEYVSAACGTPVISGATQITPVTACVNTPIALELTGNSTGSGQTYQWQSSSNGSTFTNIGSPAGQGVDVTATFTLYYRAMVTCAGNTVYSNPVQVIVNPYLPAGTYTINAGQSTSGTNFHSFGDAVLAMHCGIAGPVVFNVVQGSGPYTEQVIIPAITNTSKTNTVTFNGNGEVLKYTSTVTGQRGVLKLDGADYIIIDGLTIQATGAAGTEYGYCIHMLNDADNNIIRNCTLSATTISTTNQFAGIVISATATSPTSAGVTGCDSNLITKNTITGGYYGICVTSGDPSPTYKNVLTGNTIRDAANYGIYSTATDSLVVENNDISRPARTNSTTFVGIEMAAAVKRFIVNKNRLHNFFGAMLSTSGTITGIDVRGAATDASAPGKVSNNLMYDFNGSTVQYGFYNSSSSYVTYYHNTVSLDDSTTAFNKASYGYYQNNDVTGIELKNNLFTMRRANTALSYALYMKTGGIVYVSDYNDFLIGASGYTKMGYFNTAAYTALADWQTGVSQDAHSLTLNPAYEDPANGNFKPAASTTSQVPFNDKGTPVGVTADFLSVARSTSTPDIGAYEFGCSSFPAAVVTADSIAVCSGSPVSFQIKTPEAGVSYTWYTTPTGITPVYTGNPYTVNNVTGPVDYWVMGATAIGCTNGTRTHVKAVAYTALAAPVAVVDTIGVDMVRFKWNSVPGATGYIVSRDGVNFTAPSSGATGLTHTVSALRPLDTVSLVVKAVGVISCQEAVSARVSARTRNNEFFIPNTFTPNGDGRNDVFAVYGNTIKSVKVMVFNQWGEKVFESASQSTGWDGSYKGKQQPIGVYVYVVNVVLNDGSVFVKKGSLNLVR